MNNYLYRVEYRDPVTGWMGADGLTFDTEGMAEAHMSRITDHAYNDRYRVVRRPISAWEALPDGE